MRRLLPFLLGIWGTVVLGVLLNIAANLPFGSPRAEFVTFLHEYWRVLLLACLGLGSLTLWAWIDRARQKRVEREYQLRQYFALCKPAADVRLDDLDPYDRPHYTYIPRTAVPYDPRSHADYQQVYDETALTHALQQGKGRGFVLLGQPLEGRTRTLYEIVKRLRGYEVVRPFPDRPTPPRDAFALFKTHRVIILLDDLNSYAQSGGPDLLEFSRALKDSAVT